MFHAVHFLDPGLTFWFAYFRHQRRWLGKYSMTDLNNGLSRAFISARRKKTKRCHVKCHLLVSFKPPEMHKGMETQLTQHCCCDCAKHVMWHAPFSFWLGSVSVAKHLVITLDRFTRWARTQQKTQCKASWPRVKSSVSKLHVRNVPILGTKHGVKSHHVFLVNWKYFCAQTVYFTLHWDGVSVWTVCLRPDDAQSCYFCCPLQDSVGGKVRLMLTGAAPISAHVLTFLRAALGCQVWENKTRTQFKYPSLFSSMLLYCWI